mgnify:CR=1 FL=1
MIKLNLGCASRPLDAYTNIDMDSLEDIKKRYPNININEPADFVQANVLELPFEAVSYTNLRAHETVLVPVCRFLIEKSLIHIHPTRRPHHI